MAIGTRLMVMPAMLWTHLMSLYTTDPTTGAYTVAGLANQPCRLCETSRKNTPGAPLRVYGEEARVLLYQPGLAMDPSMQVQIDDERYQIASGTDQAARGPSGELVYRSWDVLHVSPPGVDL